MTTQPRLTVLLGSGFSEGVSLSSTASLTELVRTLPGPELYGEPVPGGSRRVVVPAGIWRMATGYYVNPNFETMLHLVETALAYSWVKGWLAAEDRAKSAFGAFMNVMPHWQAFIEQGAAFSFVDFYRRALDAIAADIRQNIDKNATLIEREANRLLLPLAERFQLTIGTLNYDDIAEAALKNWHDGFEQDSEARYAFTPSAFVGNRETPELLHLHGSVRFYRLPDIRDTIFRAESSQLVPPQTREPTSQAAQSGELILIGPMISGLRKADKVSTSPFGYYQHRFQEALMHSASLLVVGYGGGDAYINNLILEMRRIHGDALRVAFITKHVDTQLFRHSGLLISALALGVEQATQDAFAAECTRTMGNSQFVRWGEGLLFLDGFPLEDAMIDELMDFFQTPR